MRHAHSMPFGAEPLDDGSTRFRLWAPAQPKVELLLETGIERVVVKAKPGVDGWHEVVVSGVAPGTRYRYRLGDGLVVPDPASRFNPGDVHGASEVVDPRAYHWSDGDWRGRPWHEAVVYEMHVGAFTPAGVFTEASERLAELAMLGVTAVELMPVADFPGARNWGYDGVLPFAPDASYGTPAELKAFVDHAHALGLMVLLDVVYNHFGPEGNYLNATAPLFFDPRRHTPWGAGIRFEGEGSRTVRDFFVHNALYWVEEFRIDGLRLDAVHAIDDRGSPDIVEEIAAALRDGPGRDRQVHLVLENDRNEAHYLARDDAGRTRCASAQWNDDVHHAFHVLLTGQSDGYYADYADAPLERLGKGLAQGFVYQGEPSRFRDGAKRGEPSVDLPPAAFVNFLQTHDQVGNRAFGERIDAIAGGERVPAAIACLLLAPQVPMLFMGEEWAASAPFMFFCDFGPELAKAVSEGRRAEFARFEAFRDEAARSRIPDPNAKSTFEASKLEWSERARSPHREREALVRELLAIRRQALFPRLCAARGRASFQVDDGGLRLRWPLGDGTHLHHLLRLSDEPAGGVAAPPGEVVFELGVTRGDGEALALAPAALVVTLEPADD